MELQVKTRVNKQIKFANGQNKNSEKEPEKSTEKKSWKGYKGFLLSEEKLGERQSKCRLGKGLLIFKMYEKKGKERR